MACLHAKRLQYLLLLSPEKRRKNKSFVMEVITGRELLLFFFPGKPFSLSEPITVGREGLMPKEKERERGNKNRVCCGEDVQNIFISIAKFKRILKKFSIYFAPTTTTTTWTTIRPRLAAKRKSKSRGNNSYHQRGEERDPSLRPLLSFLRRRSGLLRKMRWGRRRRVSLFSSLMV